MSGSMVALQYDRYGGPEVLELRRIPIPAPGTGQVLVRVAASGLNPKDALIREGAFRRFSGSSFPKLTGFDLAGQVAVLGPGVTDLAVGERVYGFLDGFQGGAVAEYVAVPREWLAPAPVSVTDPEAAALPLVGLTALQALRDRAQLKPAERLLIKGASGGVGSAAIQLAKIMGAHVTALAGAASLAHCRSLGADVALDYASLGPNDLTSDFDVVFDCYGDTPELRAARLVKRGSRLVTVAPTPGILFRSLLSSFLPGSRTFAVFVKPRRADLLALAEYVEAGRLRMPVEATYGLSQAHEAHAAVHARHTRGKRVLLIHPGPEDRTASGASAMLRT